MHSWIIALIILTAAVALIIYSLIRDKKHGKSSCSHGCSNCAMHGQCYKGKNKF
ncbi:MAG: FeoB-associated Cys-rich membrane protein [Ruminococcus flavefaciens]|nr:FeoB-associated Cys-rich membrane protein [Ruminococcus flavefaciens]MCM1059752.1 FeoB-associated Cys-rich membrane protein [Eubacterium sp.]